MRTTKLGYLLVLASFIVLVLGCNKTNQSYVKQTFHNITARNNPYFNANEKYKVIFQNLVASTKDDYDETLSLFAYDVKEAATSYSGEFKEIIEKCTKAIQKHESSKWTDDCYLLIGKSHYHKGDYKESIKVLRYLTSEYKKGYLNAILKPEFKKDPKDPKPSKASRGMVNHSPARNEAILWLVRSYAKNGQFDEAQSILTYAQADPTFPEKLKSDLDKIEAQFYIDKEENYLAIGAIQSFLEKTKSKPERARAHFILAQLQAKVKSDANAIQNYEAVLKNRPNYEMAFYAQLRAAQLSRMAGLPAEGIRNNLKALAKDEKNEEFYDQIYYELAYIEYSAGQYGQAEGYLEQSIAASNNNQTQLALSNLLLGDIKFEQEYYKASSAAYDSTLALIDTEFENYEAISSRADILRKLVQEITTVEVQDSLMDLAQMSEKQLDRYIAKAIEDRIEREEEARLAAEKAENNANTIDPNAVATASPGFNGISNPRKPGANFYFNNPTAVTKGAQDFVKLWGSRKLEDNWRRSDKNSFGDDFDNLEANNNYNPEAYDTEFATLKAAIPRTQEAKDSSNRMVVDAFYSMSNIYKGDLDNVPRAIKALEELNLRFPDHYLLLESYYSLYLLHARAQNKPKAALYKKLILENFGNSNIARILKDPSYFAKAQQASEKVQKYYEETFAMFEAGRYDKVIDRVNKSYSLFSGNSLQARFDFLRAQAMAQKQQYSEYVATLNHIVHRYPEQDDVRQKAQEILEFLNALDENYDPTKLLANNNKPQTDIAVNQDTGKVVSKSGFTPKKTKLGTVGADQFEANAKKETAALNSKVEAAQNQNSKELKENEKEIAESIKSEDESAEEEARAKRSAEEKVKAAQKLKEEQIAKEKAEKEAKEKAAREAEQKALAEAKQKAEKEKLAKAEQKAKREQEAKEKAAREAEQKALAEAKEKAEKEKLAKAEQKAKKEQEAKEKAAREAEQKALAEAKQKAEKEAKEKAEAEQKALAEAKEKAERKAKEEQEAKEKAAQEAEQKALADAAESAEKEAENPASSEAEEPEETSASAIYGSTPTGPHFVVIALNKSVVPTEVVSAIENFNSSKQSDLKVESLNLNSKQRLIVSKTFGSSAAAMRHYRQMSTSTDEFLSGVAPEKYNIFVISSLNYSMLFFERSIEGYLPFFKQEYLNE